MNSCSSIDFTGPRSLHCLARADTRARAWWRVGGWLELRWARGEREEEQGEGEDEENMKEGRRKEKGGGGRRGKRGGEDGG